MFPSFLCDRTATDVEEYRKRLISERAALLAQDVSSGADCAPVTLEQYSVGGLSRIDAMQVQAMALAQQRRRQVERAAIDAAVQRIDEGGFGYCLVCGQKIVEGRLIHSPAASTCVNCARGA